MMWCHRVSWLETPWPRSHPLLPSPSLPSPPCICCRRFLVGLGIGQCSVVVPAYLGETTPASCRGFVVELYEVSLVFGMILSSAVDYALSGLKNDWRWMVGVPTIPGFLLMIGPWFLPESPRWLVMKSREKGECGTLFRNVQDDDRILTTSSTPTHARESRGPGGAPQD